MVGFYSNTFRDVTIIDNCLRFGTLNHKEGISRNAASAEYHYVVSIMFDGIGNIFKSIRWVDQSIILCTNLKFRALLLN